jgi:antitoxin (DNA-binding transcriptional repressor) of toxin-antitoxin stability system
MSEQPTTVSADGLDAASQQATAWQNAVRRAQHGETVAVIAHGEHVTDVVPSGELDRLRETIQVLSDTDLVLALSDLTPEVHGRDAIRALATDRTTREQQ